MLLQLFVLFLLLSNTISPAPPANETGIQLGFTTQGLDIWINAFLPLISQAMGEIAIPKIAGWEKISTGNLTYSISNIAVDSVDASDFEIRTSPSDQAIEYVLRHGILQMEFSWSYKFTTFPYLGDSGHATATVDPLEVKALLPFIRNEDVGTVLLVDPKIDVTIHDIQLDLGGKAKWLYDLVLKIFKKFIVSTMNGALSDAFTTIINTTVNTALDSWIPYTIIDQVCSMDSRLTRHSALWQPSSVAVPLRGMMCPADEPNCPMALQPGPIPQITSERHVQIYLDRVVFYSLLETHRQKNSFDYTLLPHDLPDEYASLLQSSTYFDAVPGLKNLEDMPLALRISHPDPLKFQVMPVAGYLELPMVVEVWTQATNDTIEDSDHIITLNVVAGHTAHLDVNDDEAIPRLVLVFESYNLSITLQDTLVGDVNVDDPTLQQALGLLLSAGEAPYLTHAVKAAGVFLPTVVDISLVHRQEVFGDTWMAFLADYQLKNAAAQREWERSRRRRDRIELLRRLYRLRRVYLRSQRELRRAKQIQQPDKEA